MYNLPNILTIIRIAVVPIIFLSIYIHNVTWATFVAVLFVLACITDYFDGYLARARNEISVFGRLLDPIADKLLVVSALVVILVDGMVSKVSFIPVVVILCREVLVSGLREFLAEVKVSMPVTKLAKWKTGFQMTAISLILFVNVNWAPPLGEALLWVAGVLTFVTGYEYFQKSLDYIKKIEKAVKVAEVKVEAPKKVAAKKKPVKKVGVKKAAVKKKA